MAPYVAIVDFLVIFGLGLAGFDSGFETKIFACFACSGNERPAMHRVAGALSDECLGSVLSIETQPHDAMNLRYKAVIARKV